MIFLGDNGARGWKAVSLVDGKLLAILYDAMRIVRSWNASNFILPKNSVIVLGSCHFLPPNTLEVLAADDRYERQREVSATERRKAAVRSCAEQPGLPIQTSASKTSPVTCLSEARCRRTSEHRSGLNVGDTQRYGSPNPGKLRTAATESPLGTVQTRIDASPSFLEDLHPLRWSCSADVRIRR